MYLANSSCGLFSNCLSSLCGVDTRSSVRRFTNDTQTMAAGRESNEINMSRHSYSKINSNLYSSSGFKENHIIDWNGSDIGQTFLRRITSRTLGGSENTFRYVGKGGKNMNISNLMNTDEGAYLLSNLYNRL